jgi:hypothetical protein
VKQSFGDAAQGNVSEEWKQMVEPFQVKWFWTGVCDEASRELAKGHVGIELDDFDLMSPEVRLLLQLLINGFGLSAVPGPG